MSLRPSNLLVPDFLAMDLADTYGSCNPELERIRRAANKENLHPNQIFSMVGRSKKIKGTKKTSSAASRKVSAAMAAAVATPFHAGPTPMSQATCSRGGERIHLCFHSHLKFTLKKIPVQLRVGDPLIPPHI